MRVIAWVWLVIWLSRQIISVRNMAYNGEIHYIININGQYRGKSDSNTAINNHWNASWLKTLFYKNGVKQVPRSVVLNPTMLAVWFMDDGSKCRASDVYINTQQFAREDQKSCLALLASLGIDASLNRDKEYLRIRIKKDSLSNFFDTIRSQIIPSMTYKLNHDPVETCS